MTTHRQFWAKLLRDVRDQADSAKDSFVGEAAKNRKPVEVFLEAALLCREAALKLETAAKVLDTSGSHSG